MGHEVRNEQASNPAGGPVSGGAGDRSRDVAFESGGLRLAGSYSEPARPGSFPALLMLAGSGQTDRDDNAPKLRIDALRQIAMFLALKGFASLRYDKRGVGDSEGDYWKTGFDDRLITGRRASTIASPTRQQASHGSARRAPSILTESSCLAIAKAPCLPSALRARLCRWPAWSCWRGPDAPARRP